MHNTREWQREGSGESGRGTGKVRGAERRALGCVDFEHLSAHTYTHTCTRVEKARIGQGTT